MKQAIDSYHRHIISFRGAHRPQGRRGKERRRGERGSSRPRSSIVGVGRGNVRTQAKATGIPVSISPDSHASRSLSSQEPSRGLGISKAPNFGEGLSLQSTVSSVATSRPACTAVPLLTTTRLRKCLLSGRRVEGGGTRPERSVGQMTTLLTRHHRPWCEPSPTMRTRRVRRVAPPA